MIPTLGTIVYSLCFLTSTLCAVLLARSYMRTRLPLLLWSALCFVLLAANNFMVVIDLLVVPSMDLQLLRHVLSLSAVGMLLYGFIWDDER